MNEQETTPLLDQEQLQMLVDAGGPESYALFNEILELYMEESTAKLAEIRQHRDARDLESLGRAAHALAGSSANIGGLRVWKLSKEIENLCKEGNAEEAFQSLTKLDAAYSRTVEALKNYGPSSSDA